MPCVHEQSTEQEIQTGDCSESNHFRKSLTYAYTRQPFLAKEQLFTAAKTQPVDNSVDLLSAAG
jgi:hypothetical protein